MNFGTDGIRGRFGSAELSVAVATRLGAALFARLGPVRLGVVRDTRQSGPELIEGLRAGFGGEVVDFGVQPTAALSAILRDGRADFGVAVTASHNPWQDNGLKLLGAGGFKLTLKDEGAIAALGDAPPVRGTLRTEGFDHAAAVRALLPDGRWLEGVHVALDAAHGAGFEVGPRLLKDLGARVSAIGVAPDGVNINEGLGAVHPDRLAAFLLETGADVGLCLDGDADRCILVNARGQVVDGDALLLLLGAGEGVVGTVMCNAALPRALAERGMGFDRAGVGDRQVAARMRELGWQVGGEPSGHVLLNDGLPTGDGLLTGLRVLAGGLDLVARLDGFRLDPQAKINLRVARKPPLSSVPELVQAEQEVLQSGAERVLLRYSGTEPKLRILVEAPDADLARSLAERIAAVAETYLGS